MAAVNIRLGNKAFFDAKHFPRGFSRSGEFSISESYLLEKFGDTLNQLATGSLKPENEEERRFVAVCQGKYCPESSPEKLWLKYVEKTSPKKFHTLFGSRKVSSVNDIEKDLEELEVG